MTNKYAWYRELNRYQWFVLLVCSFGWMFDLMAQQAGFATSVLMIGWAAGGIVFGVLGDRIGRVKTMALAILLYSLFTGASTFATGRNPPTSSSAERRKSIDLPITSGWPVNSSIPATP